MTPQALYALGLLFLPVVNPGEVPKGEAPNAVQVDDINAWLKANGYPLPRENTATVPTEPLRISRPRTYLGGRIVQETPAGIVVSGPGGPKPIGRIPPGFEPFAGRKEYARRPNIIVKPDGTHYFPLGGSLINLGKQPAGSPGLLPNQQWATSQAEYDTAWKHFDAACAQVNQKLALQERRRRLGRLGLNSPGVEKALDAAHRDGEK